MRDLLSPLIGIFGWAVSSLTPGLAHATSAWPVVSRLDRPPSAFSRVPVMDQGVTETCFATVGAEYYSMYAGTTCDPLDATFGAEVGENKRSGQATLANGGHFCNVIKYYNERPSGCCSMNAYGPQSAKWSTSQRLTALLEAYKKKIDPVSKQAGMFFDSIEQDISRIKPSWAQQESCPKTEIPLSKSSIAAIASDYSQIEYQWVLGNWPNHHPLDDAPYDRLATLLVYHAITEQCTEHRFAAPHPLTCTDTSVVGPARDIALNAIVQSFFGQKPMPIPLGICSNFLFKPSAFSAQYQKTHHDFGLRYLSDPSNTRDSDDYCGDHVILAIGARCKGQAPESCEVLLRNSHGTSCTQYHPDFANPGRCEQGQIWVPYALLRDNFNSYSVVGP